MTIESMTAKRVAERADCDKTAAGRRLGSVAGSPMKIPPSVREVLVLTKTSDCFGSMQLTQGFLTIEFFKPSELGT